MNEEQEALKKLENSLAVLIVKFPFLGRLALHLKLRARPELNTAATDGIHYFYAPQYIAQLKQTEVNFVTMHEVMHIVFNHIERCRERDLDFVTYNFASDYVINAAIRELDPTQEIFKMPKHVLYKKKYAGLYTEEVYVLLLKSSIEQGVIDRYKKQKDAQERVEGQGTHPIDAHDVWRELYDRLSPSEIEQHEREWRRRIDSEIRHYDGRFAGNFAGSMFRRFLLERTMPKKNWRRLLHEFLAFESNDFGFNPPNPNMMHLSQFGYDVIMPDWSEQEPVLRNIVFAVDTSGSIDDAQFQLVHNEITACLQMFGGRVEGKLIYCDAHIPDDGVYDIVNVKNALPVGGGGTSFIPVFEWIAANWHNQCAGLVYLTDGYGEFPDVAPPYPVLWVLLRKNHKHEVEVPFGSRTELNMD